jgi:hypothetical protein
VDTARRFVLAIATAVLRESIPLPMQTDLLVRARRGLWALAGRGDAELGNIFLREVTYREYLRRSRDPNHDFLEGIEIPAFRKYSTFWSPPSREFWRADESWTMERAQCWATPQGAPMPGPCSITLVAVMPGMNQSMTAAALRIPLQTPQPSASLLPPPPQQVPPQEPAPLMSPDRTTQAPPSPVKGLARGRSPTPPPDLDAMAVAARNEDGTGTVHSSLLHISGPQKRVVHTRLPHVTSVNATLAARMTRPLRAAVEGPGSPPASRLENGSVMVLDNRMCESDRVYISISLFPFVVDASIKRSSKGSAPVTVSLPPGSGKMFRV